MKRQLTRRIKDRGRDLGRSKRLLESVSLESPRIKCGNLVTSRAERRDSFTAGSRRRRRRKSSTEIIPSRSQSRVPARPREQLAQAIRFRSGKKTRSSSAFSVASRRAAPCRGRIVGVQYTRYYGPRSSPRNPREPGRTNYASEVGVMGRKMRRETARSRVARGRRGTFPSGGLFTIQQGTRACRGDSR